MFFFQLSIHIKQVEYQNQVSPSLSSKLLDVNDDVFQAKDQRKVVNPVMMILNQVINHDHQVKRELLGQVEIER
jgi:hypothetical protein